MTPAEAVYWHRLNGVFFGAFLPQFVTPGPDARFQLALLAITFLTLAAGLDSLWAVFAARFSRATRINVGCSTRQPGHHEA